MKRKTLRRLSILLALCMAVSLLPGMALAAETSGTCGDGVTWSYSNGTLTISGTGKMGDFVTFDENGQMLGSNINSDEGPLQVPNSPWANYTPEIHTVIIGDGVTSIGNEAFSNCVNLSSITIPDSVTSIGKSSFYLCIRLSNVTIPEGVTTILQEAFNYCYGLTSVTIPASVTSIGMAAFHRSGLKDVYYSGSESQWEQVDIDNFADANKEIHNANIHYSAGITTPEPAPAPAPSGTSVTVNGSAVAWTDAEPFIDANDRTMVPLRAVADAMSLEVNWDAAAREAVFTDGSKTIYFPIDSSTARTSDGGSVTMDTAAVIVSGRTYAPIRYLAEFFGYTVGWDAASRTVSITA